MTRSRGPSGRSQQWPSASESGTLLPGEPWLVARSAMDLRRQKDSFKSLTFELIRPFSKCQLFRHCDISFVLGSMVKRRAAILTGKIDFVLFHKSNGSRRLNELEFA